MQLLNTKQIADRLGVVPITVRRMAERGDFIKPVQITSRRIGFDEGEFIAWLAARPRGKLKQPEQLASLV
jgi:predicted DNA-binding transcriptional regulator AlpA